MRSNIVFLTLAAVLTGTLHAELKPNPLFSDGAVLQRGQKIPVWGSARDAQVGRDTEMAKRALEIQERLKTLGQP